MGKVEHMLQIEIEESQNDSSEDPAAGRPGSAPGRPAADPFASGQPDGS